MLEHSPGLPLKLKDLSRHVNRVLKSKAVKQKDVYGTFKSDGQEISAIEWQELKNQFPSFFAHK